MIGESLGALSDGFDEDPECAEPQGAGRLAELLIEISDGDAELGAASGLIFRGGKYCRGCAEISQAAVDDHTVTLVRRLAEPAGPSRRSDTLREA